MRRSLSTVALLASTLALAACGVGGDAADVPDAETATDGDAAALYEQELRAAAEVVRTASERLADDAVDPEQLAAELEEASRRVDQSSPPYDALPGHQRLSQALGEAADAAAGLQEDEPPFDPETLEGLRAALVEAEDALDELEEQGYDLRRQT